MTKTLSPSKQLDPAEIWKRIIEKVAPAVGDIVERRDNGKIEIHFSSGDFTRARKDVTL